MSIDVLVVHLHLGPELDSKQVEKGAAQDGTGFGPPPEIVVATCQTKFVFLAAHMQYTTYTPHKCRLILSSGSQPTGHSRPNVLDPLGPSTKENCPGPGGNGETSLAAAQDKRARRTEDPWNPFS